MYDEQQIDQSLIDTKGKLLGSLLAFTKVFFELRTGVEFKISSPLGREPHAITVSRELTKVFYGETTDLLIQIPPRYGKTELLIHFVAWCIARYPDCNFLYLSYSHNLASTQTAIIRDIITMPYYKKLFNVELSGSSSAKDEFTTTAGGLIRASGFSGTVTGYGAGIRGITDRFSGCICVDDAHKPDEVSSDTMREGVIENYNNTIPSRRNNGSRTPIVAIAQSLHEADLMEKLKTTGKFTQVILPARDQHNNVLDPELHSLKDLNEMERLSPYVFSAQYQQCPQPAGGGLFKIDNFPILDNEPKILATFITADTAETEKTYNDATVFSFWGVYKIVQAYSELDVYALHWIDCVEIWVEPKDLQNEFINFYTGCMRFHVKPQFAAIERKSTGTTLVSILSTLQGFNIINIERSGASKSKTDRFIDCQPFVNSKLITLPYGAKHTKMCIEHMRKITANNTHSRDDVADTCSDAIKIALIDKVAINISRTSREEDSKKIKQIIAGQSKTFEHRSSIWE